MALGDQPLARRTFPGFIHVGAGLSTSFLFIAGEYFTVPDMLGE